jgi:hypothetical protein
MSLAYPAPWLIKAQILERVTRGETVRAICAEPGMPCADSIQVWRRTDPGFAAELAVARTRGDYRRRLAFDEAKAEAFLRRLRAGERVRDLLNRPGMPTQGTYRHWRLTEASFQEELFRLKGLRDQARGERLRGRHRAFDQAVADKILVRCVRGGRLRDVLAADPALPCRGVVYRWRKERPDWDGALRTAFRWGRHARGHPRAMLTPEMTDAIVERIVEGESLRSLAREPGMPAARTLYDWVSRRPAFAAEVAQACDWREDWFRDQAEIILEEAGPIGGKALRQQLSPLRTRWARLQNRPGRKWRERSEAGP